MKETLRLLLIVVFAICVVNFAAEWIALSSPALADTGVQAVPGVAAPEAQAAPLSGLQEVLAFVVTATIGVLVGVMAMFPVLREEIS